jgi:hypothetical protein
MPRIQTSGFASIPNALLDRLGHNKNIGWLYLWLFRHGNGSESGAWASISTLAHECCMKPASVKAGLRWLVDHGWVVRRSRPGRTSCYLLRMDPPPNAGPPKGGAAAPTQSPEGGQAPKGTRVLKGTQDLGTEGDLGTKRAPGTEWAPPPGSQTDPTTWGPNGPHKQEPRNKIQGTRTPSSLKSLTPLSLPAAGQARSETKGEKDSGEEQPASRPAELWPPAPEGLWETWTPEQQAEQEALEAAYHGPKGAPEDPHWRFIHASPGFPWGGPYAPQPPEEAPAEAPRLPVPVAQLPQGLRPIADRVEAYWLGKGGARSPAAFQAVVEELELVLDRAGRQGVVELLRQALQAGWPALNGSLWLAQRQREPDLSRHPAYRPFQAS